MNVRARGLMGRRKGERRLVNPVSKMAERSTLADFMQSENFENGPFHRAYIGRKLPCPYISCRGEAGKVFFEEKGLAQHFWVKHLGVFSLPSLLPSHQSTFNRTEHDKQERSSRSICFDKE